MAFKIGTILPNFNQRFFFFFFLGGGGGGRGALEEALTPRTESPNNDSIGIKTKNALTTE